MYAHPLLQKCPTLSKTSKDNTLFTLAARWLQLQNAGSLLEANALSTQILYLFKENAINDFLWPTCYLPSNIPDKYLYFYSQNRYIYLNTIFKSYCQETTFTYDKSNLSRSHSRLILSPSMSTHINSFPIPKLFTDIEDDELNIQYKVLPKFPISTSDLCLIESSDLVNITIDYHKCCLSVIRDFISLSHEFPLIVDATYGTPDTFEGLGELLSVATGYTQAYGYHRSGSLLYDRSYETLPQNWSISFDALRQIKKRLDSLASSKSKRYKVAFPCAIYKYSEEFWSNIVELIVFGNVIKIGICCNPFAQDSFLESLLKLGIPPDCVCGVSCW